jgi:hypothetical protein
MPAPLVAAQNGSILPVRQFGHNAAPGQGKPRVANRPQVFRRSDDSNSKIGSGMGMQKVLMSAYGT